MVDLEDVIYGILIVAIMGMVLLWCAGGIR